MQSIDYQRELNEEQLRAVCDGDGPCLVLAGAGSGKTRTLVYRVAYLLENGVLPENIMLLTFTNKAAKEMEGRVSELLGRTSSGLWSGTFHSTANRLLRKFGNALGYDPRFSILDADDSRRLINVCRAEMGIPKGEKSFPKADVIGKIISFAKNSCKPVEDVIADKFAYLNYGVVEAVERIYRNYETRKRQSNSMDFDDLLCNWENLLKNYPEIRHHVSSQFRYVLVDEYQDTNKVQSSIIYHLAKEHKNLLVVGDDAQSIYSFRAATVSNILDFEKTYHNAKKFKLETNYRSTPEVLALANQSISFNFNQHQKSLKSLRDSGDKPYLVTVKNNYEQADFICKRIREEEEKGSLLSESVVLFRSSAQAIELELELNKRGIPYIVRGGLRFFDQGHIKDVLAYLRLIANPQDEISWRRVLLLYEGIGPKACDSIWEQIKNFSELKGSIQAFSDISVSKKAKNSLLKLGNILDPILDLKEDIVSTAITKILEDGYEEYLQSHFDNYRDRLVDLEQMGEFASQYSSLEDFLSEISLSESFRGDKKSITGNDVLVLSTIHQAKGLEWKNVFLIGLAQGIFPHYRTFDSPKEMEEERRLFYVAVTRAKDKLYCIFPLMTGNSFREMKRNRPSAFIEEVDSSLFEKWGEKPKEYNFNNTDTEEFFSDELISDGGLLGKIAKANKKRSTSFNSWDDDGFFKDDSVDY